MNEAAYFGKETQAPEPGEIAFLSGGSPCQVRRRRRLSPSLSFDLKLILDARAQGFSRLNRFKTLDDLRCAEPFVFLTSLAVFRPIYALYENVAAFETHALPYAKPGHERGSFFELFVAVATALRYQLRWTVVNAAGYVPFPPSSLGPQREQRTPSARADCRPPRAGTASPSFARASSSSSPPRACASPRCRRPRTPSRTLGLGATTAWSTSATRSSRGRPRSALLTRPSRSSRRSTTCRRSTSRAATTPTRATSPDLCVLLLSYLSRSRTSSTVARSRARRSHPEQFGAEGKPKKAAEYGTIARTTFQQRCRTYLDEQGPAFSGGVTHHWCRSLSETVARRVLGVKIGGNHESASTSCACSRSRSTKPPHGPLTDVVLAARPSRPQGQVVLPRAAAQRSVEQRQAREVVETVHARHDSLAAAHDAQLRRVVAGRAAPLQPAAPSLNA